MRRIRRHLTYANVVSTLCLFILLGGVGYAASKIGASDIKKNAVRSRHIKNGQVRGQDVANDSLTGRDVDEANLSGIGAGVVMGRIQDAAAGGTATRYGTPAGIAASSGDESGRDGDPPVLLQCQGNGLSGPPGG
jgi:hypothetical protein